MQVNLWLIAAVLGLLLWQRFPCLSLRNRNVYWFHSVNQMWTCDMNSLFIFADLSSAILEAVLLNFAKTVMGTNLLHLFLNSFSSSPKQIIYMYYGQPLQRTICPIENKSCRFMGYRTKSIADQGLEKVLVPSTWRIFCPIDSTADQKVHVGLNSWDACLRLRQNQSSIQLGSLEKCCWYVATPKVSVSACW